MDKKMVMEFIIIKMENNTRDNEKKIKNTEKEKREIFLVILNKENEIREYLLIKRNL